MDIDESQFVGHEAALYVYVVDLPKDQAVGILRRQLATGAWLRHPEGFVNAIRRLDQRASLAPVVSAKLLRDVGRALVALPSPFEEGTQKATVSLFTHVGRRRDLGETIASLVDWICREAGPGDARFVGDLIEQTSTDGTDGRWSAPETLRPLARWMVERGAAELRSPARNLLLMKILDLALGTRDGLFVPALRATLRNEQGAQYVAHGTKNKGNGSAPSGAAAATISAGGLDI